MKLIDQTAELLYVTPEANKHIERAGRICYKSESKITERSSDLFIKRLKSMGHFSVIEHASASFLYRTNRGVTHELVRHRLASYSQESTRYIRYKECEFIKPTWFDSATSPAQTLFTDACTNAEHYYKLLLDKGWKPEEAREVLPNAIKTEIVMTANLREWMHVFDLRCSKKAHPQIRALMLEAKALLAAEVPVLFD